MSQANLSFELAQNTPNLNANSFDTFGNQTSWSTYSSSQSLVLVRSNYYKNDSSYFGKKLRITLNEAQLQAGYDAVKGLLFSSDNPFFVCKIDPSQKSGQITLYLHPDKQVGGEPHYSAGRNELIKKFVSELELTLDKANIKPGNTIQTNVSATAWKYTSYSNEKTVNADLKNDTLFKTLSAAPDNTKLSAIAAESSRYDPDLAKLRESFGELYKVPQSSLPRYHPPGAGADAMGSSNLPNDKVLELTKHLQSYLTKKKIEFISFSDFEKIGIEQKGELFFLETDTELIVRRSKEELYLDVILPLADKNLASLGEYTYHNSYKDKDILKVYKPDLTDKSLDRYVGSKLAPFHDVIDGKNILLQHNQKGDRASAIAMLVLDQGGGGIIKFFSQRILLIIKIRKMRLMSWLVALKGQAIRHIAHPLKKILIILKMLLSNMVQPLFQWTTRLVSM